jgi:hypothetical protein
MNAGREVNTHLDEAALIQSFRIKQGARQR